MSTSRQGWLCFALSFSFLLSVSEAKFIVEQHSLTVSSDSIKGTFESAIANFGIPQYGGSMAGQVVYVEGEKAKACDAFKEVFRTGPGDLPKIVLVDRGGCFFTEKVWWAQQAGASAVLVADDKMENLITMDAPEDDPETNKYLANITIPSALVRKNTSDAIKLAIKKGELVNVNMDWTESLPHPDERVEFEFWTNSNDECGQKCEVQSSFVKEFKGIAQTMEQGGYTQFVPHYITWYCPPSYIQSKQCSTQCINNGRYCSPDPEHNFNIGYDGKDVVVENLRQLCVFKQGRDMGKPWVWWDYVTDFKLRCKMADKNYNKGCAEKVIQSLGLDVRRIQDCIGDPTRDVDNPVLKAEQEAQVGRGSRSDVTILPTLVINNKQYRGKLDSTAVLKAICSGFQEATDPPQCLGKDIQTNECVGSHNGGCWKEGNYSACLDTFRGKVCQCPRDAVSGLTFIGDGFTSCKPAGVGRCLLNNGGCWSGSGQGKTFSACQDMLPGTGCKCPAGFMGDGFSCTDIDECAAGSTVCKCPECKCTNTYGAYTCGCSASSVYIKEHDACISKTGSAAKVSDIGWVVTLVAMLSLLAVAIGGYVLYKYRLRSYMDSEIRAIMAQYMPLDSANEPMTSRQPHEEA